MLLFPIVKTLQKNKHRCLKDYRMKSRDTSLDVNHNIQKKIFQSKEKKLMETFNNQLF